MKNKLVHRSLSIASMLSIAGLILWLLYYFDAAPLYFELLVFHKKMISVSILMGVWILIMLVTIILRGRIIFTWSHALLLTLIMYLLITTIIQYVITPNLINAIGMSSFATIVLHIALFLILLTQMMVPERIAQATINKWLLILSVPVIYFGISQVIDGYSSITMVIFNDYVKNVPHDFYGVNRPYSFFTQSSNFGWYTAFLSALLWLSTIKSTSPFGKLSYFFALIIAVIVNILSFTRVSILANVFIFLFLWYSKSLTAHRKNSVFIPLVFFATSIILFFYASDLSGILKDVLGVLASSSSTSTRESELFYYLNIFGAAKWWQILIGIGPIINLVPAKANMFIDNTYLYILLQDGVVGIILWLFVTAIIWRDMYLMAQREPTILRIATVAFWSTWLAVGVFATDLSTYILMAIIFYMASPKVDMRSSVINLETKVREA